MTILLIVLLVIFLGGGFGYSRNVGANANLTNVLWILAVVVLVVLLLRLLGVWTYDFRM